MQRKYLSFNHCPIQFSIDTVYSIKAKMT